MCEETGGLDVRKVVLSVWARLEDEDAQGRIRRCKSSNDYARRGSACERSQVKTIGVYGCQDYRYALIEK